MTPAVRFLLSLAAFVIIVAGMRAAEALLIPFLLSLFIAVIAAPPLFYLKERGLPSGVAMLIVVAMIVVIGLLIGWMIGGSLNDFTANLPKYQERLSVQGVKLANWLSGWGLHLDQQMIKTIVNPAKAMAMAGQVITGLGNVLAQALLILITVIFMLIEATAFQAKIHAISQNPEASLERIEAITSSIKRYMTLVAFLFNYVPNLGSIIAAVPAVLLALVQGDPQIAFWTAVGYLVVNNLVGNVIEPRFMGSGLGLSPLIVFVSLVFWGWILGPVGMFLSVPLTMTLKIFLDSYEASQGIGRLLGAAEPTK
ncbi:MAG: AI-2E family transporter [Candidatus Thiodiazotropha sp.]